MLERIKLSEVASILKSLGINKLAIAAIKSQVKTINHRSLFWMAVRGQRLYVTDGTTAIRADCNAPAQTILLLTSERCFMGLNIETLIETLEWHDRMGRGQVLKGYTLITT